MGTLHDATCRHCGKSFEYSEGGGFQFAIIQCDLCHRARSVSWEDKKNSDTHGPCDCGGTFRNDAVVRCPHCDSPDIQDMGIKLYFD